MSGSDLAPFVAAVLNDRTVAGLIQENNELKSKLTDRDNERLLVEVTGQHGSPVYYEESFKNAERYRGDHIFLGFGSRDGFPLSSIGEIKIRLGGVVVQRFNIDDLIIHFCECVYDEENRMEKIWLQHNINRRHLYGPIEYVHGYMGPWPLGWRQGLAGHDMLLTDLLERVADDNNNLIPQTLII
ncbi:hypothetical protein FRACYDRAFT_271570, partial [Fragilariopsis cylindrus CCMP1102]